MWLMIMLANSYGSSEDILPLKTDNFTDKTATHSNSNKSEIPNV